LQYRLVKLSRGVMALLCSLITDAQEIRSLVAQEERFDTNSTSVMLWYHELLILLFLALKDGI